MFDEEYETIPSNLGDLQAGPELGGVLACIEVDRVSPYDRVVVLQGHQRQASHHEAERYRAMTAVMDAMGIDDPRWAAEAAEAEIGAALHLTRRATARELSFAIDVHRRLPQVWQALATGRLDVWRAKVIADRTAHLTPAGAHQVVERIIDHAPRLTTGQLRARLNRLGMEADPESARKRYAYSVADRRVVTEATGDGTANLLGLNLPPQRAHAISRRVDKIARGLHTKGETRTMDQLRADVYLDLLQGKDAPGGVIHLHTDLDTLTALAEHPGELNGYGPVIADLARQVAEDQPEAEWRYTITATATGHPITTGVTRRRPTTAQRRHVEAHHPTCIFPGCRMPAVDCDLDHRQRWTDGGTTRQANLAPLCRHNHITKDTLGWHYRPLPYGDYLWTSRLGHTYTTSGYPP